MLFHTETIQKVFMNVSGVPQRLFDQRTRSKMPKNKAKRCLNEENGIASGYSPTSRIMVQNPIENLRDPRGYTLRDQHLHEFFE